MSISQWERIEDKGSGLAEGAAALLQRVQGASQNEYAVAFKAHGTTLPMTMDVQPVRRIQVSEQRQCTTARSGACMHGRWTHACPFR